MSKQRILLISVDAFPNVGGVSNYTHYLANEFAQKCSETVLLAPKGAHIPQGYDNKYKLVEDFNSDVKARTHEGYERQRLRLVNLIKGIVDHYSLNRLLLVHPFYYGPAAMDVAKDYDIPCEVIVHGTEITSQFPEVIGDHGDLGPVTPGTLPHYLYTTLARANCIIGNSSYTLGLAQKIARNSKGCVSGCGVPNELIDLLHGSYAKDIGTKRITRLEQGTRFKFAICYIGRLVDHKRVEKAIELTNAMDDTQLRIIGDGPLRAELEDKVQNLGMQDNVLFCGQVSEPEKWDILSSSDFLVLPSSYSQKTGGYEGFGIVLLEAIAAGTIPVATASEGTFDPLEIYKIGIAGLNEDLDVEETAQKLMMLATDHEQYRKKIESDFAMLNKNLKWEHVAGRIMKGWTE